MNKSSKFRTFKEKILKQARIFLLRGFFVLPIPPRQKAPRLKGWTELRLEEHDLEEAFREDDNLGVILGEASGGLVDVDLDSEEAVALASSFLPATERIHGRKGKRRSHWWYRVEPSPAPVQFADVDHSMLVELRSNGQQTITPPSVHPSGERLYWNVARKPGRVDADTLLTALGKVAAGALLARHWPSQGSRHEASKALAGLLLRSGWPADQAEQFVTAVARASMRDEEWSTRKSDIRTTVRRLAQGLPATGIPRLTEFVGEPVVARAMEWLGIRQQITLPDNFLGSADVLRWPAAPADIAFQGLAGEIVWTIDPSTEADPVAILIQLLLGFGSIVGNRPHLSVEASRHTTNIFSVLVGPTSKGRKGVSWAQVLQLLREADPEWAKNCVQSGVSTGQGLISSVRDPVFRRQLEEGSTEDFKLVLVDAGVEDKRLFVFESEFAQPLKLMSQPGNILSNVIRQAWDTGDLQTLTKTNPVRATGAHITLLCHVTQHELQRYLTQTEQANGFGNRFLWIAVRRSKFLPDGGRLKETERSRLCNQLQKSIEFAKSINQLKRSKVARELWHAVYPGLSEGKMGLLGALTGRAEAQVTRLALIFALLDRSRLILRQHLEAALALWGYAESSVRFIFGGSLGDGVGDEILKALRTLPQGLTRTEISNLFARHRNAAEIGRGLGLLAQSGLATFRHERTDGRPEERWLALGYGPTNEK